MDQVHRGHSGRVSRGHVAVDGVDGEMGGIFFENPIVYVCMLEEDHNGE